ncbi:MAG: BrnA antitoxin family protein [Gammaproteobacteria bacterium]|nr:BrnA antitoxin family protein [Gammaproteobacteria bacterium]
MLARAVLKRGERPVGRPPIENPKVAISIRLPPDVVARWRASGAGWHAWPKYWKSEHRRCCPKNRSG